MEFAALKFFGFAISAALQFFLFTLIRRYRRLERLERLFLTLITCLFLWNFCNFLLLLFEKTASPLSGFLLSIGVIPLAFCSLALLPSLLLHIHLAFQMRYLSKPVIVVNRIWVIAVYLPLLLLPGALAEFLDKYRSSKDILVGSTLSQPFAAWFSFSLLASAFLEWRMLRETRNHNERNLFKTFILIFLFVAGLVSYAYLISDFHTELEQGGYLEALLMLWSIIPSVLFGYHVFRNNFLEVAIQRSLGYPFAAVLLLLFYLLSIKWVRDLVEAERFPRGVVEAGMILVLFPLLQPLKRWIDAAIDGLFSREISTFQEISSRLDGVSRSTVELEHFLSSTEKLLQRELNFTEVKVKLHAIPRRGDSLQAPKMNAGQQGESVLITKGNEILGEIHVQAQSGKPSSEQQASLKFLIPQIVASIEICQMAEGKIQLERELAERSKMASLGQMAATVAHNIKNPLSSIKTIVQLMQEDEELMVKYARDLSLINSEVDRLTHSVTQLLKFSKPLVMGTTTVDLLAALEKIILIFRPDAERKGILLELEPISGPLKIAGNDEVLVEVFQNLVVNALEVSPENSRILVRCEILESEGRRRVSIQVEDEGPGIAHEIQAQIFKPFFTTKQKGTGLGLAVVQRRVLDMGGEVDCVSPLSPAGGTRFAVKLPLAD